MAMGGGQLGVVVGYLRQVAGVEGIKYLDDRELLRRFAEAREEQAFAVLMRRHGRMVWGVCRHVLGHEQDGEDAFQATFLTLACRAGSIRKAEAVASWLHGTAYRIARRAQRDAATRRAHERRGGTMPRQRTSSGSDLGEALAVLDEEVARLGDKQRAVFVLCHLEGKSRLEAARQLGWKEGTVTGTLARARQQLKRRLECRGITLSAVLGLFALGQGSSAAVPAALTGLTFEAAKSCASGPLGVTARTSAPVVALVQGACKSMLLGKLKCVTGVFVAILLACGAYVVAGTGAQTKVEKSKNQAMKPPAVTSVQPSIAQVKQSAADDKDSIAYSGCVVGPDGRPVAGAKLNLSRAVDYPASPEHTTSGSDGRFKFTVPKAKFGDQYATIVAAAPSFGAAWVDVPEGAKRDDLTLQLVDDVPITGQIIDLEGKPVPGATVLVQDIHAAPGDDLGPWLEAARGKKGLRFELQNQYLTRFTRAFSAKVATDIEGRFRLTGIGRNRIVEVQLDGPTITSELLHIVTRPGKPIEVTEYPGEPASLNEFPTRVITCYGASFRHAAAPTRPIVGVVRDSQTKRPLAGVTIRSFTFATFPNHMKEIVRTTTDDLGRYRLIGMPRGKGNKIMVIPAHEQPFPPVHAQVPDSPGLDPVNVDFDLKRGVWIEGKITDKVTGKPLQARVEYFALYTNPNLREYKDFDGTILIGGNGKGTSPDGTYRVIGLPGPGLVVVWRMDDYLLALNRDDEYSIDKKGLSTAPYQLLPLENYGAFARVDPPKGVESGRRDATLDPGWTFTGTVLGPDGKLLAEERIGGVWGWGWQGHKLTKTGAFTATRFNPRRPQDVIFHHRELGLVANAQSPKENGASVTVRLERGATVTGRLVDAKGRPRASVKLTVSFRLKDRSSTYPYFREPIETDRDGQFLIEALLPGYEYRLSDDNGELSFGPAIRLGQTKDLGDVRIKRAEE